MYKMIITLCTALLLLSCGSKKELVKPDLTQKSETGEPKKEIVKNDQTKSQDIDQQIFSIMPYDKNDIDLKKLLPPEAESDTDFRVVEVPGFRIQIVVLSDFSRAKEFEETLIDQLKETIHAVHNDFYSPNYRIRVGDFETRDEARKNLPLIKSLGYNDAFIVPAKIKVQKKISLRN